MENLPTHIPYFKMENFKLFSEEVRFDFAPITFITGKNNGGKSSIFKALNLLSNLVQQRFEQLRNLQNVTDLRLMIGQSFKYDVLNLVSNNGVSNKFILGFPDRRYRSLEKYRRELVIEVCDPSSGELRINEFNLVHDIDGSVLVAFNKGDLPGSYELAIDYLKLYADFSRLCEISYDVQNALSVIWDIKAEDKSEIRDRAVIIKLELLKKHNLRLDLNRFHSIGDYLIWCLSDDIGRMLYTRVLTTLHHGN